MPYREASAPQPTQERIRYGPFARQRRQIATILAGVLLVCFLTAGITGHSESLTCDRARGRCTLITKYAFVPVWFRSFPIDAVTRVHGSRFSSAARVSGGYTELSFKSEPSLKVMEIEGAGWLPRFEAIHAFFSAADQPRLAVSSWPRLALLLVLIWPVGAIFLLRSALRPPSAIELIVLSPTALRVRRRWPARLSRSSTMSLDGVSKIRIVRKTVPGITAEAPDRPGALICLVKEDGEATAINREPLPGVEVHERAAEALRGALHLSEPVEVV